jgi:hypothetical protein
LLSYIQGFSNHKLYYRLNNLKVPVKFIYYETPFLFMADPKYRGRRQEVILPSPQVLEKWKSEAAAKGLSVSSWIFETVEGRDIDTSSRSADAQEIKALRDELRNLKKERDAMQLELEKERTALFKLKHATLLQPSGRDQIERNIINALRRGGFGMSEIF